MEHLHSGGSFGLIVWSVDVTSLMSTGETSLSFNFMPFRKSKTEKEKTRLALSGKERREHIFT